MKIIFNKSNIISKFMMLAMLVFVAQSCFNDLNTVPLDEESVTSGVVYDNPDTYKQVLAKLYAGLAVSGQEGPAGKADISGIDEGFGQYLRGLWYHQELPTDEAVIGWNDQTIKNFHNQNWSSDDGFTFAFYSRVFYQIPLCNEFLRETTDEKLNERGVEASLVEEIQGFRAEARFLRALSYWHALDIFRNVPFVTEDDKVGSFFPEQISGPDLFSYIESELIAIESEIATAGSNEYGRADQGAVWMLLAKLYLNAEVYTNNSKYDECLDYCEKLIESGAYSLEQEFEYMFLADNHLSDEIIFPVTFDGLFTKTYGGTTFIIRAGIGGDIDPLASGVESGWAGTRVTKQIVNLFGQGIGGEIAPFVERKNEAAIYIPGDYQGNEINKDFSLTKPIGEDHYEGHQYFSEANTTFMIAPYPDLGFLYGDNGADGNLDIAGSPLQTGDAGYYFISVNLTDKTIILEKRDYSVTGSAVSEETTFEWDAESELLKANVTLIPGELYFRSNGTDENKIGDTGFDGILDYDGDPVEIVEGDPVEIFLDLKKRHYIYRIASLAYDRRAIFDNTGQNLEIEDLTLFNDGYAVTKFKNITRNGEYGSHLEYPDTDFPMFRLGDVYLMASEAIYRNNGDLAKATEYFNEIRSRAWQSSKANIDASELSLDQILDERGRELMWECHRRTDLIRFGKFSDSNYFWDWKGGIKEGKSVEAFRDIFPIPSADLGANTNLVQNPGY